MPNQIELEEGWLTEVIDDAVSDIENWPETMKSMIQMIEDQAA